MSVEDTSNGVTISADEKLTEFWAECNRFIGTMNASQARMDENFREIWAEVQQGQKDAAVKELKWARYEKLYAFKRKALPLCTRSNCSSPQLQFSTNTSRHPGAVPVPYLQAP